MDFIEWLKTQTKEINEAFEGHVKGLKRALQNERDARRMTEAGRLAPEALLEEGFSFSDTATLLISELEKTEKTSWVELVDLYEDAVIYRRNGEMWRRNYTLSEQGDVTYGAAERVVRQYQAITPRPHYFLRSISPMGRCLR